VRVVLAFDSHHEERNIHVVDGTCARTAVFTATEQGLPLKESALDPATVAIGVFGEEVSDDYVLQHGDRVEIYRSLQQDPKELRRDRAKREMAPQRQQRGG